MASHNTTPARRGVLSELNVNSPIAFASGPESRKATSGTEKPLLLGEALYQTALKQQGMVVAVPREAGLLGTKRRDHDMAQALERSSKMRKTEDSQGARQISDGPVRVLLRRNVGSEVAVEFEHEKTSFTSRRPHVTTSLTSSPASASPVSSSGFSETALNETQLTEPDESRVAPLTQAELREKARAIRLRLRLASYKIRTNQINLPMSRLQIKTTTFDRLPTHRTGISRAQHRTPLPSSSSIPNIKLQKPSAEKQRLVELMSSSPPPMLRTASDKSFEKTSPTKRCEEETREEFHTPLLPRHRQGLLNPPNLGSPTRDELTSSVIKRGTADVLLSLKLQR